MNIPGRKDRRGFASMDRDKQRQIASKGGRAAHSKGTAHQWSSDEARAAGRKGGLISRGGRGRASVPLSSASAESLEREDRWSTLGRYAADDER